MRKNVILLSLVLATGIAGLVFADTQKDLWSAAERGDLNAAKKALKAGANANNFRVRKTLEASASGIIETTDPASKSFAKKKMTLKNIIKESQLCLAIYGGHLEMVKLLMKKNAQTDKAFILEDYAAPGRFGAQKIKKTVTRSAIFVAQDHKKQKIVNYLKTQVKKRKQLLSKQQNVQSNFWTAAATGNIEKAKKALGAGADINKKKNKKAALAYAIEGGHLKMVKFLVKKGKKGKTDIASYLRTLPYPS